MAAEHHEKHRGRGEELAREDLSVTERVREQQLHRAELPLLGEQPHRQERDGERHPFGRHVDEPQLEEIVEDVHPEAELGEEVEIGVEEPAAKTRNTAATT